jgi:hypothetical protein
MGSWIHTGDEAVREEMGHRIDTLENIVMFATEDVVRLRAEVERLTGWLKLIEGGDTPCFNEAQLRQWANEALTSICEQHR